MIMMRPRPFPKVSHATLTGATRIICPSVRASRRPTRLSMQPTFRGVPSCVFDHHHELLQEHNRTHRTVAVNGRNIQT